MFLKVSQNSQENTYARVTFLIKLHGHWCFLVNFEKFLRTLLFEGLKYYFVFNSRFAFQFLAYGHNVVLMWEIRDYEDIWQWSWLEIRLNAFRRSTMSQKQFIIINLCSKCKQIRNKLRFCSRLPKISLTENFIFCAV